MTTPRLPSPGPCPDWTAGDYDSFEVLVAVGARHPAARVTRARLLRSPEGRADHVATEDTMTDTAIAGPAPTNPGALADLISRPDTDTDALYGRLASQVGEASAEVLWGVALMQLPQSFPAGARSGSGQVSK